MASYGTAAKAPAVHLTIKQIKLQFAVYAVALIVIVGAIVAGVAIHTQNIANSQAKTINCLPGIASDKCR
jgi:hypothetical protein